jgi:DNA-binding response OmpR family regulator
MARILVIDDDIPLSRLLEEQLTDQGFEVESAALAKEGLEMAVKSPPDLILLDLMLPDETGFQTCGKLRQNAETQSVPILMMSSVLKIPSQHALGRIMGANDSIEKPFAMSEVTERIHALLNPAGVTLISGDEQAAQEPPPWRRRSHR